MRKNMSVGTNGNAGHNCFGQYEWRFITTPRRLGFGLLMLVCALFMAPHLRADTVLFIDSSGSGTEVIPGYYTAAHN
jgi:hypothetical protein